MILYSTNHWTYFDFIYQHFVCITTQMINKEIIQTGQWLLINWITVTNKRTYFRAHQLVIMLFHTFKLELWYFTFWRNKIGTNRFFSNSIKITKLCKGMHNLVVNCIIVSTTYPYEQLYRCYTIKNILVWNLKVEATTFTLKQCLQ